MLTDVWPLFGLVLRTPRLELRLPSLEQLAAVGELAATSRQVVRDRLTTEQRLLLDRAGWDAHRTVPVGIEGLEPCRPLLGAEVTAGVPGS